MSRKSVREAVVSALTSAGRFQQVYDGPARSVGGQSPVAIVLSLGTETQEADPFLEQLEGAGNVPGYRGLCYIVGHGFPLKRFGNRMPNFRVEVVDAVTLTYPTETLTLSGVGGDGLLLSRARPLLYAWDSGSGMGLDSE